MNRTHRLLDLLCAGRAPAWQLARTLGCGLRTIYREVARLRALGWEVAAAPGPHGGLWLAPGSKPAPVTVSAHAVREVALALSVLHRLQGGASPVGADALARTLAALSPSDRRDAETLLNGLSVEGARAEPVPHAAADTLAALQRASGARHELLCASAAGPERLVPTGLALAGGAWMVLGTRLRSLLGPEPSAVRLPLAELRHARARPPPVHRTRPGRLPMG